MANQYPFAGPPNTYNEPLARALDGRLTPGEAVECAAAGPNRAIAITRSRVMVWSSILANRLIWEFPVEALKTVRIDSQPGTTTVFATNTEGTERALIELPGGSASAAGALRKAFRRVRISVSPPVEVTAQRGSGSRKNRNRKSAPASTPKADQTAESVKPAPTESISPGSGTSAGQPSVMPTPPAIPTPTKKKVYTHTTADVASTTFQEPRREPRQSPPGYVRIGHGDSASLRSVLPRTQAILASGEQILAVYQSDGVLVLTSRRLIRWRKAKASRTNLEVRLRDATGFRFETAKGKVNLVLDLVPAGTDVWVALDPLDQKHLHEQMSEAVPLARTEAIRLGEIQPSEIEQMGQNGASSPARGRHRLDRTSQAPEPQGAALSDETATQQDLPREQGQVPHSESTQDSGYVDSLRPGQLALNSLTNAAGVQPPHDLDEFQQPGGWMSLSWRAGDERTVSYQVQVRDSGTGATASFWTSERYLHFTTRELESGHDYTFCVRAVLGTSRSEFSPAITVRFDPLTAEENRAIADLLESRGWSGRAGNYYEYAFHLGDVGSAVDVAGIAMYDFHEDEAHEWLLRAANQGNAQAMERLGDQAMRIGWFDEDEAGIEVANRVPRDLEQARYWYRLAVEHGSDQARSVLGALELEAGNLEVAWGWLTYLDDPGPADVWDLINLGRCARGLGRRNEARDYFARAWNTGSYRDRAAEGLGDLARDENDPDKAAEWYERAVAENGSPWFTDCITAKMSLLRGSPTPAIDLGSSSRGQPTSKPQSQETSATPEASQCSAKRPDRRTPLLELPPGDQEKV